MPRPYKSTVDYFPHQCNHKTTMFIIEQRFGNDGYAFWFKLLELLGKTEGHAYNCTIPEKWEFLLAYTRHSEVSANIFLDCLAKLGAIDVELWSDRIVWSQNFVDGITEVYGRRRVNVPHKPLALDVIGPQEPITLGVSTNNNTQSRVEKSRVEKSRVEKSRVNSVSLPDYVSQDSWTGFLEMRKAMKKMPTPRAQALLLKSLERFHTEGQDVNKILDQSTRNNWQDVYPLRDNGGHHGRTGTGIREYTAEELKASIA